MDVDTCGFSLTHRVARRFERVLDILDTYVLPEEGTRNKSFYQRRSQRVGGPDLRIISQPTIQTKKHLVTLLHAPTTGQEDILKMGMDLVVHKQQTGYLVNMYTGQLMQVLLPEAHRIPFVQASVHATQSIEEDLSDEEFILRFQLL